MDRPVITRRAAELGFAAMTGAFGLVIAWGAREFGVGWSPSGPEPGTFPFYIGALIAAASLGNAAVALGRDPRFAAQFLSRAQLGRVAAFALPIVVFVLLALWLGLYVATALYLFFAMRAQGGYSTPHALAVGVGLPVALYLLLEKGFQTPLLKGPLEAALGL